MNCVRRSFIWLTLLIALSVTSCAYGYDTRARTTALSGTKYAPTQNLELIFGRAPHHRSYVQLAFLEIEGHATATMSDLMSEMRKRASRLGADAVVGIQKGWKRRSRGIAALDALMVIGALADAFDGDRSNNREWKSTRDSYQASVLTGTAIRYVEVPATGRARP